MYTVHHVSTSKTLEGKKSQERVWYDVHPNYLTRGSNRNNQTTEKFKIDRAVCCDGCEFCHFARCRDSCIHQHRWGSIRRCLLYHLSSCIHTVRVVWSDIDPNRQWCCYVFHVHGCRFDIDVDGFLRLVFFKYRYMRVRSWIAWRCCCCSDIGNEGRNSVLCT